MGIAEKIAQIESVLDELRPTIKMDGGDIEFVDLKDGTVYIRFLGACISCPLSTYTLKMGVEEAIKSQVSDIYEVVAVGE